MTEQFNNHFSCVCAQSCLRVPLLSMCHFSREYIYIILAIGYLLCAMHYILVAYFIRNGLSLLTLNCPSLHSGNH